MKKGNKSTGLTLIEVMVAALIIAVAVIGAINFRFFGVTHAKKADVQANATRIGSMMLETWKGLGGIIGPIDPKNPDASIAAFETAINKYAAYFTVSQAASSGTPPLFTFVKSYQVRDLGNDVYYFVTLSYRPAITGSQPEPQTLNASISWNRGYGTGGNLEHTISISTYVK